MNNSLFGLVLVSPTIYCVLKLMSQGNILPAELDHGVRTGAERKEQDRDKQRKAKSDPGSLLQFLM
jgi:hypothetical protein